MTFSLSALETSITPITAKHFGWGTMVRPTHPPRPTPNQTHPPTHPPTPPHRKTPTSSPASPCPPSVRCPPSFHPHPPQPNPPTHPPTHTSINLVSVVVTVLLGKAGRADREIIAGGFVCLLSSLLINVIGAGDGVHVALWAVVSASILLAFSLVTVSSPNSSLYTKMVGAKHQGFFNSLQCEWVGEWVDWLVCMRSTPDDF